MKVLNFGSLNYDYVYQVDHIVKDGETLDTFRMDTFCGGKGLNQSVALARAGADVFHAGCVGEDGEMLLNLCRENGIDCSCVKTVPGKSGHTIIQIDRNAQNSILLYGGSNRAVTKEFADEVLARFSEGDILLVQNEISELAYIIDRAYEKKMQIIFNPSPYNGTVAACDLSKISVFLVNEVEGEQISGEKEPDQMLDVIQAKYPQAKIVLTLGEGGVVYRDKEGTYKQGIFRVKTVDTTAAGDTFTGYFIASMLEGMEIQDALRLCAKASALAVSRNGAAPSIPTRKEVDEMEGKCFSQLE